MAKADNLHYNSSRITAAVADMELAARGGVTVRAPVPSMTPGSAKRTVSVRIDIASAVLVVVSPSAVEMVRPVDSALSGVDVLCSILAVGLMLA